MHLTLKITVSGRVQGVGFRPFIFSNAKKHKINGTVQNNMNGVFIVAQAEKENLDKFLYAIKSEPPRLSRIDEILVNEIESSLFLDFTIIPSERTGKSSLVIPVDSAICPDCIREMKDTENFRYQYPFINCTQCGPRYTIIEELPYDRPYTVMKDFNMCEKCADEYENPLNRRHHAQPIACDSCGPELILMSMEGKKIANKNNAINRVKRFLSEGSIVAIKGLGGYHLACDAHNEIAINNLRKRKKRLSRPLAVMASNMEIVKKICHVNIDEKDILNSPEAPIVVLKQILNNGLPNLLAPNMNTLGVMMPYTPIHYLLFDDNILDLLVMTSANPSGLPILYKDEQALTYLDGIADYILTTNREILHPLDDSVLQINNNSFSLFRRSRGFVPDPIKTTQNVHEIVALGGQQKNVFSLGRNNQIFLGPHIGDLDNIEVKEFFKSEYNHLMKWMGTKNKIIAIDKHPLYATREIAEELDGEIVEIQHHHAHLVSCMEDNNVNEPSFGIILDGTGYGEDGNIWGFEILYGNAKSYKRMAHLKYTPLPGNEKAIKEPWRNAVGMLIGYLGDEGKTLSKKIFMDKEYEIDIIDNMIKRNINSPLAGTCGRLFDAISAILSVCNNATYDGEPAILLSEMMYNTNDITSHYMYDIIKDDVNQLELNLSTTMLEIIDDYFSGNETVDIVQMFHNTIIDACAELICIISKEHSDFSNNVMLSGGSFLNKYLIEELEEKLRSRGFKVFTHQKVPCSDGGIAFGQIIIAANNLK